VQNVDAMIEITDWAREILEKSQAAAKRFNPDALIRLTRTPGGVQAVLTDAPLSSDQTVEAGEMTLYVEAGLDGLVDIEEPHDRLVLKPSGSKHNLRAH
jgi:hypothetical protein